MIKVAPSILSADFSKLGEEIEKISEAGAHYIHIDVMDGNFVPNITFGPAVIIVVHVEACPHLHRTIQEIKSYGVKAGVSLNPHTPVDSIKHLIPELDMVLIMSVNPGFGGQSFIPFSLDKIKQVREMSSTIDIEVDGGIVEETGKMCVDAGANILVAGSYIFGGDYKERITKLANL